MTPLVSILIPVFNREKVVKRAIDSALAQTYTNIEVIVCDNASTDSTWDILQSYAKNDKRIKAHRNTCNLGPVQNWLCCLKYASGEYVKFIWSDDAIHPNFITETIHPMINNPTIGFAFSDVQLQIGSGCIHNVYKIGVDGIYNSYMYIKEAFIQQSRMPVSPGCALFRTQDVKRFLISQIPNKQGLDFSKFGAGNDLLIFLQVAYKYPYFYFSSLYNKSSHFAILSDIFFQKKHLHLLTLYSFAFIIKLL